MPRVPPPVCAHDIGVGTTVCLRCRQEARQAARARQQRLLGMAGVIALGLVGMYVVGASATNAVRAARRSRGGDPAVDTAAVASQQAIAATPSSATPNVPAAAATPAASAHCGAPPALVIAAGRTELADSMFVERTGDDATVHFDTQVARTRRRDKFERVLRETLPTLYGPRADSLLATVPEGALVTGGNLIGELTTRGVHVALCDGWTLELWPETRPGRDGPLVVRYRTRVVKA